ncbi:hypothetical protein CK203_094615 [Vitis vinifera]|uniref:Protein BIG GRAIN 1-like E n=1 Tax=Vitis vinifera TaxID=29760 RepID=A0A438E352_VITVI|nr:hypothetical protein CK203_094615 [Vitis vinifera]
MMMREERQGWRGGRISLDMPMRSSLPTQSSHAVEKQMKEKIKYKQPSSPGGRLASFLNSLSIKQTPRRRNQSPQHSRSRMKRRARVGGGKGGAALAISGVPALLIPNHRQVVSLPNYNNGNVKATGLRNEALDEKRIKELVWLDEKFKFSSGFSEKHKNFSNGLSEKDRIWVDEYPSEEKEFRKLDEIDAGAESDSSSDLFELQNYDLGCYSSGLPALESSSTSFSRYACGVLEHWKSTTGIA